MLKKLSVIKLFLCALILCCVSCDDSGDLEKPSAPLSDREAYARLEQQIKNDLRLATTVNAAKLYADSPEQRAAFEKQYNRTSYYMQYGYTVEEASAEEARELGFSPISGGTLTPIGGGTLTPIGDGTLSPINPIGPLKPIDGGTFEPVRPQVLLSLGQVQGVENIGSIVEASSSYEDCVAALSARFDEVYNDNSLSVEDKNYMLVYITTFKAVLAYADETFAADPSMIGGRVQGWWSSWGKCVAGILGGGILGAVSTGVSSAALGTIALPVIGTVSAGAAGAVVGGIGGALAGAASSCGGMTKASDECTFDPSSTKPATINKACFSTIPLTITSIAPGVTTLRPISVLLRP